MINLAVDMHVLQGKSQGSKRYLEGLYGALNKSGHRNAIHLDYVFNPGEEVPDQEYWINNGSVRRFSASSKLSRLGYSSYALTKSNQYDYFHFQYISPLLLPCKSLVTIHDVLFESHPQYFQRGFVLRSKLLMRRSAAKASHIFTVSTYSKEQLQERYKIPDEKISVTCNAVDRNIFNPGDKQLAKSTVLRNYGVSDYILTVGRLEPRKNHVSLFRAYGQLKEKHKDLPRLVVVGNVDFGSKDIMEHAARLGIMDDVVFITSANDAQLADLYRAASCFVFPSHAEGFGIPPLEAMSCGVPVVCSNTTAMKEFSDGATLQISPNDVDEIADAILEIISDKEKAQDLVIRGVARSHNYTWDAAADVLCRAIDVVS